MTTQTNLTPDHLAELAAQFERNLFLARVEYHLAKGCYARKVPPVLNSPLTPVNEQSTIAHQPLNEEKQP